MADAKALCEAMSPPTMRFVPIKTAEQQAALMLVGLRDRLIRNRTQLSNAIRGYAAEFGFTATINREMVRAGFPDGRKAKLAPWRPRDRQAALQSAVAPDRTRSSRNVEFFRKAQSSITTTNRGSVRAGSVSTTKPLGTSEGHRATSRLYLGPDPPRTTAICPIRRPARSSAGSKKYPRPNQLLAMNALRHTRLR